jgi:hypothetical protein
MDWRNGLNFSARTVTSAKTDKEQMATGGTAASPSEAGFKGKMR